MTIFDYLNSFTKAVPLDLSDENISKDYDIYMINRWLSNIEIYIEVVNELNKSKGLSKKAHYDACYSFMPKRFVKFSYPSSKKNIDFEKIKKYISKYYQISLKQAGKYISCLTEDQVNKIVRLYERI